VAVMGRSDAFLHIRQLEAAGHSSLPAGAHIKVRIGQGQKGAALLRGRYDAGRMLHRLKEDCQISSSMALRRKAQAAVRRAAFENIQYRQSHAGTVPNSRMLSAVQESSGGS